MQFFLFLKKLLKIKIKFIPPKKNKILLYDNACVTSKNAQIFFRDGEFSIYYNRFEEINLYILLISILSPKYLQLKKNYKYHFLKRVSPKLVYTCVDNNISFYLLKDIYPEATYVADQVSMRDETFYNQCLSAIKKKNLDLKCDFFFVYGNFQKQRIEKIIKCKVLIAGDSKNNHYNIPENKKKPKKRITYISSKIRTRTSIETQILKNLIIFCKKYRYKLFFLDRDNANNKSFVKSIFGKDLEYLEIHNIKKKFNFLNNNSLVAFAHSSMGFQCLSIFKKIISFNFPKYNFYFSKKIKKSGIFWCDFDNYKMIEKKIFKILSYKQLKWQEELSKYSNEILVYDGDNKTKKNIIKNILNEK